MNSLPEAASGLKDVRLAAPNIEQKLPLPEGCPAACPGCHHRQWPLQRSLEQKQQWLGRQLAPWADQLQPIRHPGDAGRFNYRDKVCLNARWNGSHWQFGLLRRDELIPIPGCPVHSPRIRDTQALLETLLPPVEQFPLAYWLQSGRQAVLVVKQPHLPALHWLTDSLAERLTALGLDALWLHLHPSAGKKVLTKNGWHLLWGEPRSRDERGLWYGPAAFQQLVPELVEDAQREAAEFLAPNADSQVADLYCGIGSTLKRWQVAGAECIGVEIGAEAVACAKLNAPAAEVLRGSCLHRIPQLRAWSETSPRSPLLYSNPPRTGMEKALLQWIATEYRPLRIAYLSCSAGTLARDLGLLCAQGYRVRTLIPYDFFPQTRHVETLALLNLAD